MNFLWNKIYIPLWLNKNPKKVTEEELGNFIYIPLWLNKNSSNKLIKTTKLAGFTFHSD